MNAGVRSNAVEGRRAEAAVWRTRVTEQPDLALSPEYLDWLADPLNRQLYDEADEAWAFFDGLGATPEMIKLRREALGDARRAASRRWASFGGGRAAVAAALVAIILSVGALMFAAPAFPHTYRTGVAERRVVMLDDGSRLSLDAATVVKVRYSRDARRLELKRGQARFDVAHNPARPFMVDAGDRRVIATGTAFNIDLAGPEVVVTLLEGSVVVQPEAGRSVAGPGKPPVVSMKQGERLIAVAASSTPIVEPVDLQGVTAWERGQLMFTDEPLAEAVRKVNRYAAEPITVDPSAAGVRVSGAFDAADTAAFLDAMTSYFDVEAARSDDGSVVLRMQS